MTIGTIANIKEQIAQIDEQLPTLIPEDLEDQAYGMEGEYTPRALKAGIRAILSDIRGLANAPTKFVRLSTYDEREQIGQYLGSIVNTLHTRNYQETSVHIDHLKTIIRSYHVRGSSETKEELESMIGETHGMHTELREKLDEAQGRMHEQSGEMDKFVEKAKSDSESIGEISERSGKLMELLHGQQVSAQSSQASLMEALQKMDAMVATASGSSEIIGNFAKQVSARQDQLQSQQAATEKYEEALQDYASEMESGREEVRKLIESAMHALEYTTAEGISTAFTERHKEYRGRKNWLWLLGAGGCIALIVLYIVAFPFILLPDGAMEDHMAIFYRIALVSALFSGAYFCAAQYKKHKNVEEDYAYKAVLAKSIVGFLETLPDDVKGRYVDKVLGEIHKDPMRNVHEIHDVTTDKALDIFKRRRKKDTENADLDNGK